MIVICDRHFKNLEWLITVGDRVEIEPILTTSDVTVQKRVWSEDKDKYGKSYRKSLIVTDYVVPKGSYAGYRFKAANGEWYPDSTITNAVGYVALDEIFKKA